LGEAALRIRVLLEPDEVDEQRRGEEERTILHVERGLASPASGKTCGEADPSGEGRAVLRGKPRGREEDDERIDVVDGGELLARKTHVAKHARSIVPRLHVGRAIVCPARPA